MFLFGCFCFCWYCTVFDFIHADTVIRCGKFDSLTGCDLSAARAPTLYFSAETHCDLADSFMSSRCAFLLPVDGSSIGIKDCAKASGVFRVAFSAGSPSLSAHAQHLSLTARYSVSSSNSSSRCRCSLNRHQWTLALRLAYSDEKTSPFHAALLIM